MEIYNGTGKTKTGELRVTRAIGGLLIGFSMEFHALTNERINVYVERANGDNLEIASKILLKDFILASTFGQTMLRGSGGFERPFVKALCDLTDNGSIALQPNESIKVELIDLKPAQTYSINGLEYPQFAETVSDFERKQILEGELQKTLVTTGYDLMIINNFSKVTSLDVAFSNKVRNKYTNEEVQALSWDIEPVIGATDSGGVIVSAGDVLVFPLSEVDYIDFEKETGAIEVTLVSM